MKNIYLLLLSFLMTSIVSAQTTNTSNQDFNFWIGEWTVYKNGTETVAGHSKIRPILNGKGLLEEYTNPNGSFEGKSLNTYNAQENRWEQFWIDNNGTVLHITGGFADGKMIMSGTLNPNDKPQDNRISWTPNKDGTVRQLWEQKSAGQTEWTIAFDGIYKRKE